MKNTSLCYIEKDGKYLMLHRTKKQNDENGGKWIGVGGKFNAGESPEDCIRREILEETGLFAQKLDYRAVITFVSDEWGTEYMHLFTCDSFCGELTENCDEGELKWVDKKDVLKLCLWEGDKIFLKELTRSDKSFFSLKLIYSKDTLINSEINRY